MSDNARHPRRKAERLHANQTQPRPARRSEQGVPRVKEQVDAEAKASLRQAEQKFQAIFDNTSDGIFLLDLEARKLTMCNRSCLQMLGYTLEEFLKLSIADLHPAADLAFIRAQIEEFLQGGQPIRHDIRFQRKDGSIVFTDLTPNLVVLNGRRYILVALKDITERKRAEEALQSECDQARQYLQVAGVMIVALDADGRITLINEKGCEILGYQQEEILGRDWFDVCLPREIRAEVRGVFHRLMAGDIMPVEYYENTVLRQDGQQRIVAFHNTVLRDPFSRIVGVLSSGEDVTGRRRAEEALAASERRYRSLVQNIPDVTWTTDQQGHTLFISSNVTDVYGYSVEEICTGGDTWLGNVHPDDRPRVEKAFDELFTQKKPYDVEYRIRRKDGTWIWLHDRSVSRYEKNGRWYADGVFSDVTERKRMEEELRQHTEHLEELVAARTGELRESEARYRSLYHTIADGIFVMGADGRIEEVNDSACAQLGYTREELVGMPVSAVSARPDFNLGEIIDHLRRAGSLAYDTVHRRKNGALIPVELSVAFVEYRGRSAILGVARDITERKQAEEALRRMNEQLEAQVAQRTEDLRRTVARLRQLTLELSQAEDRERRRIAGILHEDVQQTLAAARFHLNLLGREARSVEESQEIVEQVQRMLRDAIERSRGLSHELSPALYQVGLTEILDWLARHMRQEHGLTVQVEAHGPVDSPSELLKVFLYKVVQELLFNVVKHAGGSAARLRTRRLGTSLYLSVTDWGRGFDPEKLEGAAGFGLLSIRERVQLLGGRMKIRSRPGAGSRVLILVPDQETAGHGRGQPPVEVPSSPAPRLGR